MDRSGLTACGGIKTDGECQALIEMSVPRISECVLGELPHKAAASAELN